jgi:hypothetical protein
MSTRTIETGIHTGKTLAQCPSSSILWASRHEKNFSDSHAWVARDAKKLLEAAAQAFAQVETLAELEARHEKEMAVKIAEHLVATPPRVDLGLKGHLSNNRSFQLMR